jgi:hypothetical protein
MRNFLLKKSSTFFSQYADIFIIQYLDIFDYVDYVMYEILEQIKFIPVYRFTINRYFRFPFRPHRMQNTVSTYLAQAKYLDSG